MTTRPFDIMQAQAGAPYGLLNGLDAKIYHYGKEKLIGVQYGTGGAEYAGEWHLDGSHTFPGHQGALDLVMRVPEPKWPQTSMSRTELVEAFDRRGIISWHEGLVNAVNVAIAHECEAGTLVPASMLEKVAKAVLDECERCAGKHASRIWGFPAITKIEVDIPSIIASVRTKTALL